MTSQTPPDVAALTAVQLLVTDYQEAAAASTAALAQVDVLTGELTAAQQQNQILAADLAAAPKPTLFGASTEGPQNAAGVAAIDAKYGLAVPTLRHFCTGVAVIPAGVTGRNVIGSWNTPGAGDAAYMAWCKRSFLRHEIDHAWMEQTSTAAKTALVTAFIDEMNTAHKADATGSLGVCFTADILTNAAKAGLANAILSGCPWLDHIGWDFDGVSPKGATGTYHPYDKELAALVAFLKAHPQVTSWGVPEFGANRAQKDPTGVTRASWMSKYAGKLAAVGAEYVTAWSATSQVGSTFDTPAEIATLAALMQV